jgi:hypothetical protein
VGQLDASDQIYPGIPAHHVVDSINFVSSGSGRGRMKLMMSGPEWAAYLGRPDRTVVEVALDHTGQLSLVMELKE